MELEIIVFGEISQTYGGSQSSGTQVPRIWCPLPAFEGTRHAMVHIHTCRENTHKVNLLKNIIFPLFSEILIILFMPKNSVWLPSIVHSALG